MSSYGPPGGPYPGQPQDPWQGGGQEQPNEPYRWGNHDNWGAAPASGAPVGEPYTEPSDPPPWQPPSYNDGAGATWSPSSEPPRRRRWGLIVASIVGVLVLLCVGGPVAYYLVSGARKDGGSTADPVTKAPTQEPTTQPPQEPTATPTPTGGGSSSDVFGAKVGDCLANEGTDNVPKMRKATCAAGTYEVLKRLAGTIDKDKCNGVTGYTHNYFYDSTSDDKDFVLCLKQR
jgi:hypothetical protein